MVRSKAVLGLITALLLISACTPPKKTKTLEGVIEDVSPQTDTFSVTTQHSVSGRIASLAAAADSQRLYAGTYSGIWRSDDAGRTWRQLRRPQPAASTC